MADTTITYETLFDLLRRERNREELQSLDPSFFADVLDYMKQKQSVLDGFGDQSPMFASAEAEKARIQFHNIKKILKELYDRREKKIALLALNAVRTNAPPISADGFLAEEKLLYDELHSLFGKYRIEVLESVLRQAAPFGKTLSSHAPIASKTQTSSTPTARAPEPSTPAPEQASEQPASAAVLVKFLKAVPRFAGEDEVFGPFSAGDQAQLPEKIAHVLLKKGRAEQL